MNEVASVFDACVAEPTQIEIDTDVFQAWTQGITVTELISTLKSSLLHQYDLISSASGSGYATLARRAHHSSEEDDEDSAAAAPVEDELNAEEAPNTPMRRGHTGEVEDGGTAFGTPRLKGRPHPREDGAADADSEVDSIAVAMHQQLRRADALGVSSSDDEDAQLPRVRPHTSRRNSVTASVSGRLQSRPRGTPQLPANPSPLFAAASAPSPRPTSPVRWSHEPSIPPPSSIDVLSSNQAQARLLWAWETQLEYQYRLYALIEHSLRKPFLLNLHFCVLQLSFQIQLQLTNIYYEFDAAVMRHLMGQKLSNKTRGAIVGIVDKLKEERAQQTRTPSRRNSASNLSSASHSSTSAPPSSVGSVRFSSACRQFDNLRRLYRSRWGEKGDGVIVETDMRLDDLEARSAGLMPGTASSISSRDRWRNMRAAAVAAMAKRGFGVDKASASIGTASSVPRPATHSRPSVSDRGGLGIGGGLDDFFGFDSTSQPMLIEQTAPVFFQHQFRLHSTLARRYARLVFLAHYRIDTITKPSKSHAPIRFEEVELIAQILMRCWAVRVNTHGAETRQKTNEGGESKKDDGDSEETTDTNRAQSAGSAEDASDQTLSIRAAPMHALSSSVPTQTRTLLSVHAVSVVPSVGGPLLHLIDTDEKSAASPRHACTGAAADGYDFLPIVAQMTEQDEDTWVGDVIDEEFMQGLKSLKSFMPSRLLEEYATLMARSFRDITAPTQTPSHALARSQPPPISRHSSLSSISGVPHLSVDAAADLVRPAVLIKFQSKLFAWLKVLHGLSVSLAQSKRLRSLLSDLQEEVLKPMVKLGCTTREVDYIMRTARAVVSQLSTAAPFGIDRAPAREEDPRSSHSRVPSAAGVADAARATLDPTHRALLDWCRYLEAVGPIAVILYTAMTTTPPA